MSLNANEASLVSVIMDLYQDEDYDYMEQTVKSGAELLGIMTVDAEVDFIEGCSEFLSREVGFDVCETLSVESLRRVAEAVLKRIEDIERAVFARYNRTYQKKQYSYVVTYEVEL